MKDVIYFCGGILLFIFSVYIGLELMNNLGAILMFFGMLIGLVMISKGWSMHNTIHIIGKFSNESL